MEIAKKQLIQIVIGIIFLMFIIIFFLSYDEHNKSVTSKIYKNGKLAISKVIEYKPKDYGGARTSGHPSEVQIEFLCKDSLISGKQFGNEFFVPSDTLNDKINYLVVYDSINPSRFRVLFDCPIQDSADFYKYISDSARILKDLEHYDKKLDRRI